MNYNKIYEAIIEHARKRPITGYTENHHIMPRSLGGSDESTNMVKLTGREHFLAHWLLWKIHQCPKTAHAFFMMTMRSDGQRRSVTSKQYEVAKKAMSEAKKGPNNFWYGTSGPMGGRTHAPDFYERHSVIMKKASEYKRGKPVSEVPGFNTGCGIPTQWGNVPPWNKGLKGELSHSFGRRGTPETRAKMRKPKIQVTCPHCLKTGGKPVMSRFHFDNCKYIK